MGQSQTCEYEYQQQDWLQLKASKSNLPYRQVRNSKTGIEGQLYNLSIDQSSDSQLQQQRYQWRFKTKNRHIVRVLQFHIQNDVSSDFCKSSYDATVVTEKIIILLKDIKVKLTYEEQMILFIGSFKGFKEIFQKQSFFYVNDAMIGLTSFGEVKVWKNQIFGSNKESQNFNYSPDLLKSEKIQEKLIQNLRKTIKISRKEEDYFFWRQLDSSVSLQIVNKILQQKAQKIFGTNYNEIILNINMNNIKPNLHPSRYAEFNLNTYNTINRNTRSNNWRATEQSYFGERIDRSQQTNHATII